MLKFKDLILNSSKTFMAVCRQWLIRRQIIVTELALNGFASDAIFMSMPVYLLFLRYLCLIFQVLLPTPEMSRVPL